MAFQENKTILRATATAAIVLLAAGGCSNVSRFASKDKPTASQVVDPFKNRPPEAIVVTPQYADHTVVQTSTRADISQHPQANDLSSSVWSPSTKPAAQAPSRRFRPTNTIERLPPTSASAADSIGAVRPASWDADIANGNDGVSDALVQPAALDLALTRENGGTRSGATDAGATAVSSAAADNDGQTTYPIDLANALGLAGADNLEIRLARERVFEAEARFDRAQVLWLPSISLGVGYNKHDGRLQATRGDVIEAGRNSLFIGGGLGYDGIPPAGGSSGPARLALNLSLADAAFEPLAECQLTAAESAASQATGNNTLLRTALAYFDLVEAHAMLANNEQTAAMADRMAEHVSTFEKEGYSSKAEVARAEAEAAHWQQLVADSQRDAIVKSTVLARLIRLSPQITLIPVEVRIVPVELVDAQTPVDSLVAQGLASRPEIAQHDAIAHATGFRANEEQWRPWLPNVQVGISAGTFGGGPSTQFRQSAGRSDVDLLAVWQLENFGLGTNARRRERDSQHWQSEIAAEIVREQVAAEIVAAAADVDGLRRQIDISEGAISPARKSYELNDDRIREGEGLPVEVIQSIRALAAAQAAHAKAVLDFNRAQYRLLRAVGQPARAN